MRQTYTQTCQMEQEEGTEIYVIFNYLDAITCSTMMPQAQCSMDSKAGNLNSILAAFYR